MSACICHGFHEDRGGGYVEWMLESNPDCPEHFPEQAETAPADLYDRSLTNGPESAPERQDSAAGFVDGSLTLRERMTKVLNEHVGGFQYDGPSGSCDSEDCTFKGRQAIGTRGGVGPDEVALQAGHQADLLLPIIAEAVAAQTAVLQAAVDRVRALHNADGLRWVGFPRADRQEAYCQGCNKAAPCPDMEALEGTEEDLAAADLRGRVAAAESVVARLRLRHAPVRRGHPHRTYCAVCVEDGGQDGALPVRYPCPVIEALDGES